MLFYTHFIIIPKKSNNCKRKDKYLLKNTLKPEQVNNSIKNSTFLRTVLKK